MAFLGHLGPLRLLRPMGHEPRSVGHLGPFWPNPMRPKGASHLGPPEPILATTSLDPKVTKNLMDIILAINPVGPNFGHGPIVQPWPLAATRGHKIRSVRLSPQL
ncbi:hypothetical protein O181_120430 [Austropuccinia psidii MF-1]|uniref:Uncharacterized protein n=1 Tax=Austropuccinia psidii MF-1 TaxID=1389203 RepID=A0A9Q3Q1B0_9BASI|nr:hypothetical protein [Austropuccinia psidii MF-1]